MRVVAGLLGCITLLSVTSAARADEKEETRRVRVKYDAPAACPPRTVFEGAMHFRSSRVIAVDPASDAAFDAKVTLAPRGNGVFEGTLHMTPSGGETTTRQINGSKCSTVVEALAFTAALLLDPEGINTGALPSDVELTQIAEAARTKANEPPPAAEPPPTPPPTEEKPKPPPPPPPPPSPSPVERRALAISAELGGGLWNAASGVGPRGHLALGLRWDTESALSPYARLGAFVEAPGEASSQFGTVSFVPLGGRIDLGLLVRIGRTLRAGGGLHFTTLVMPVDAPSAQERIPSVRVVPSSGVAARLEWSPSWIGLAAEGAAGAHFVRESFRIETRDDPARSGEVFRLPALYLQATIGVLVHFR